MPKSTLAALLIGLAVASTLGAMLRGQVKKTAALEQKIDQLRDDAKENASMAVMAVDRSEPILKAHFDALIRTGNPDEAKRVANVVIANRRLSDWVQWQDADPILRKPRAY